MQIRGDSPCKAPKVDGYLIFRGTSCPSNWENEAMCLFWKMLKARTIEHCPNRTGKASGSGCLCQQAPCRCSAFPGGIRLHFHGF